MNASNCKAADSTDSLEVEASKPDFITASLLTIGPGEAVYSLYGHTALRLQCPSHKLDYCFAFEMPVTPGQELRFLFTTAKAGFTVMQTSLFTDKYRQEGRGISQTVLNLLPGEKQELWRLLDVELERGAHWDYDFLTTNCSSMCIWMVEQALLKAGEHICYSALPEAVDSGTYDDLLKHISAHAPWARLFWTLRMGNRGSDTGQAAYKLAPPLLAEAWQNATITGDNGQSRPMTVGKPKQLLPQTLDVSRPSVITPTMTLVMTLILIAIAVLSLRLLKKKHKS